jgi:hypothetical protein
MTEQEQTQRQAVIAEAESWLKTPFHLNACIKGVGVDCGRFVHQVLVNCGLITGQQLPVVLEGFNLHRNEEILLGILQQVCHEVKGREPLPGDIVVYRYGRLACHLAFVKEWPIIIHAFTGCCVMEDNGAEQELIKRLTGVYSVWGGE